MGEIEEKISERIKELEEMKNEAIMQLRIQEELIIRPFDVAIAELSAFLPLEIEQPEIESEIKNKFKEHKTIPVDLNALSNPIKINKKNID